MGNAEGQSRRGNKSDFYITPRPLIRALVNNLALDGRSILDPCCGTGEIGNILEANRYEYEEGDISSGYDFYKETRNFDVIICNPPYSHKNTFLEKSFTVARDVYAILPINVCNYNDFHKHFLDREGFCSKTVLTPKCFMAQDATEHPKRGGISAYAWFHWSDTWGRDYSIEYYDDWTRYIH